MAQINLIGLSIEITMTKDSDGAVIDCSGASAKNIYLYKPSGVVLTKAAAFKTDGADGVLKYTTISGDLDEVGTYKVQGFVVDSAGNEWWSDIHSQRFLANLI